MLDPQSPEIVTTHSEVLVLALTDYGDLVFVCDYLENSTTFEWLERQNFAFSLEKFRLGEIWKMGKLGGNPQYYKAKTYE